MIYIILAFLCGGLTIFSMIVNAGLGKKVGILQGTLINYVVGLSVTGIVILIIMLTGNYHRSSFSGVPFYAFLGGLIGVMVVAASNVVIPKIPALYTAILIFIGQIFTGIIMDYVILDSISIGKIIGGIIIIIGMLYNSYVDKISLLENS